MEPAPPRKPKRRRLAAILLGSPLALAGLLLAAVAWNGARRWAAMESRVRALIEEARAADGRRPVAWGEAEPGNAWDEYSRALDQVSSVPVTSSSAYKLFLLRAPGGDRAPVEREVEALGPALERMSRGAAKAEAKPQPRWDGEDLLPYAGEGCLRRLAEIAVCKARLLRDRGDGRAIVRLLLETAQLGRDAAAATSSAYEWEGLSSLEFVYLEGVDLLSSKLLRGPELELLERGLSTVASTLPRDGRAVLNDVAHLGSCLLREDPYFEPDQVYRKRRPMTPGWPHAFSMKLFKTDAFGRWHEAARAHAAAGGLGWDEAKGVFNRITDLLERPPENPIVNRLTPPSLETNRAREAELRLLRVAVHFVRTGETEPERDPFGPAATLLRSQREGNRLRVWSRGPNGVDDEGDEASRPRSSLGSTAIIGPALGAADDIVLEVER